MFEQKANKHKIVYIFQREKWKPILDYELKLATHLYMGKTLVVPYEGMPQLNGRMNEVYDTSIMSSMNFDTRAPIASQNFWLDKVAADQNVPRTAPRVRTPSAAAMKGTIRSKIISIICWMGRILSD